MSNRLKGRVAVVTGSGQGIGRAIAIAMAKEGARIVTNNRKPGSTGLSTYGESIQRAMNNDEKEIAMRLSGDAETTANQIKDMGGEAVPFFGDVSNFEVARKLIETAVDCFGTVDILVNNASTFRRNLVWETNEEDWNHVFLVKPKSYFNCIRHAAPLMIEQGWGRIINTTSSAWLGQPYIAIYSAANAGVVGLTRSVAREVYMYGITCNAFSPRALTRAAVSTKTFYRLKDEAGISLMSLPEFPMPEELTPFLVYLATDEAAHISGTVFEVYGSHIGIYSEPTEVKTMDKKEGLWTVDELVEQVPKVLLKEYLSLAKCESLIPTTKRHQRENKTL